MNQDIPKEIYKFVSYRERSEEEVRRYVRRKSILSDAELPALIANLREHGIVDDLRFAKSRFEYRIRNGYGPFYLQRELTGLVSREIITELIATFKEETEESALKYARGLSDRGMEKENVMRKLTARGFGRREVELTLKNLYRSE